MDVEDRSRRNNLILFGIPECTEETTASLTDTVVTDLFMNTLGVQVSSVERIHRFGRKRLNKPRPIILKLIDYREKVNVLKNCSKLKGKKISISEDFSATTRSIGKKLWDSTAEIRKEGGKVKLVYNRIKIGNDMFHWYCSKMERVRAFREAPTHDQTP